MTINSAIIEQVRAIVEEQELDLDYGYIGIRIQEEPFGLGPIDHVSHIWEDGDDTGEELDGVCAINYKSLAACNGVNYYGDHIAILASDRATYGEDIGEIIMEEAEVISIIG